MRNRARKIGSAVLGAGLLASVLLLAVSCNGDKELPSNTPAEQEPDLFRDVTAGSGINFTYRNGEEAGQYVILESLGGGVALIDYDRDGLLDIFVPGGGYFDGRDKPAIKGHPGKLY